MWRDACYSITDPSSQPFPLLAPTDSYLADRVPVSHTLSLLFCLCLCNGFPALCLLISVPLLWDLARTILCSSGIPVLSSSCTKLPSLPFYPPFLVLFFSALSGPFLFSSSSTLLPLKIYGIFCLLFSLLHLFAHYSYLIVKDLLRSSASPIRYLSLSSGFSAHLISQETYIPQTQILDVVPC